MSAKVRSGVFVVAVAVSLAACSGGGSTEPRVGSPDWFWQAAEETFAAADFDKAQEHLGNIDQGERKLSAMAWRAVLLAGLGRGYLELSEAYKKGAEESDTAAAAGFNTAIQEYRRQGRRHLISLTEMLPPLRKEIGNASAVPLDFRFPAGTAVESPLLETVKDGTPLTEQQQVEAEQHTLKRGILLEVTSAVGSGEDVPQARSKFDTPPVTAPANEFMLRVGGSVAELSELFDRRHLNEPDIRKAMLSNAMNYVEPALESENEDLKAAAEEIKEKIEEAQKKLDPQKA